MEPNQAIIRHAIDNAVECLAEYACEGGIGFEALGALEAAEEFLACAADAILEDMEVI